MEHAGEKGEAVLIFKTSVADRSERRPDQLLCISYTELQEIHHTTSPHNQAEGIY